MDTKLNKLVIFNNKTNSKAQWEIILNGCGCPKNPHFWIAMRNNCLRKIDKGKNSKYILENLNEETFNKILKEYSKNNSASVQKANTKKKAIANVQARAARMKQQNYTIINGCVNVFGIEYDFD